MDYKKIVFEGYLNPVTNKYLKDYFIRQFRHAEKDNYSLDEFFDGCLNVITSFEEQIDFRYYERMNHLYMIQSKEEENEEDEALKITEIEIKNLNKDQFPEKVYFASSININYSELQTIRTIINEAFVSLQPSDNSIIFDPLDFNLNQTDIVHFFDLLVDADIIKEPLDEVHKQTKGGFYGKLSKYFTAKGRAINPNSAKQVKTNKNYKNTPYSNSYYQMLKFLENTINNKLKKK